MTLSSIFEIPGTTLRYHIQYMERHGMIFSRPVGNHLCYFHCDFAEPSPFNIPELDLSTLTQLQQRILNVVSQKPGITISELEPLFEQERRVLQYNLKVLRDRMLILKVGNGRGTSYEYATAEKLHDKLSVFLAHKLLKGEIDEDTYLRLKGKIERERMKDAPE